ncbi:MAG: peptidase [Beijerinckiaceae bacterium]|jgi:putative proteasome-type protease|nr:peptidase [Beijerinckiaceae bacterium]
MTYCCGILVRDGIVMIADTRTNAGLDNISTFRKLHVFEKPGQHAFSIATAGNLSVTQNVLHFMRNGIENAKTKELEKLEDMTDMFSAAQLIGRAVRKVGDAYGEAFEQSSVKFDVSFLFGGQIAGGPPRLFMIYTAGNFIECTPDAPFLQIGEHKYGKPILDRAVNFETELFDALKIGLISMDSTIKSNLGVGLPIDIAVTRAGAPHYEVNARIDSSDAYFRDLRERWSAALRAAHMGIPRPQYDSTS